MHPKLSFRLTLFIITLVITSLACKAATDFFVEEPVPPITEEPILMEPTIEVLPSAEVTSSALVCPAVTDKILKVATQFYEEDSSDEKQGGARRTLPGDIQRFRESHQQPLL